MENCFADNGNKCLVVLHKQCKRCNFYKTHEEARISRKNAKDRLRSLEESTRKYITEKYGVEGIV